MVASLANIDKLEFANQQGSIICHSAETEVTDVP